MGPGLASQGRARHCSLYQNASPRKMQPGSTRPQPRSRLRLCTNRCLLMTWGNLQTAPCPRPLRQLLQASLRGSDRRTTAHVLDGSVREAHLPVTPRGGVKPCLLSAFLTDLPCCVSADIVECVPQHLFCLPKCPTFIGCEIFEVLTRLWWTTHLSSKSLWD